MECYLTIKKKEILPFLSTWMELQDIKLSISNNLIKLLFFFFLIQACLPKYLPGISPPSEKLE